MKIVAYAWASGLIEFGKSCPDGALPVLVGDNKEVRSAVSVLARHSRTNDDLLVPGVPEAADQNEAVKALSRFAKRLREF
ncbi:MULTISPECIES: host nuclease inhibitor protein [Erwiniaceae]|jgi:hypothetical protein|uniref:Host nuclease inhibitor protein n=1 Tax=Mixta intestinalis TaxID=1615494 RepID=A0A6P1PZ40_9GAMM|nr:MULTISPECIES: host nuclease inhibitor protein [Erwiniaceae]MEA1062279.1 host nuclease inhibitor protein [Erwinia sp. HR93]MEA1063914.1 host nuclease inhibitor protein [Erwinia sp. HR93]QHM71643.1 hypothetical protein C7M51_01934 [Mixta intestinalis]